MNAFCKNCAYYESEWQYCFKAGCHAPEIGCCGDWKEKAEPKDSMSELYKAIKFLREQYERAEQIEGINNPLAWALYQTWRHVDEPPKEE